MKTIIPNNNNNLQRVSLGDWDGKLRKLVHEPIIAWRVEAEVLDDRFKKRSVGRPITIDISHDDEVFAIADIESGHWWIFQDVCGHGEDSLVEALNKWYFNDSKPL